MTTLSQIFQYNGYQVRTAGTAENPWFVAQDVCSILDLPNVSQACSRLDDDEKNTITINDGIPGNPEQLCISESGLYSLVLTSRKPEAKAFKKWITSEVLPSIRKTGSYVAKPMSTAEFLLAQSQLMVQMEQQLAQLSAGQEQIKAQLQEAQVKLNDQELFICANPGSFRAMLVNKVKAYAYATGKEHAKVWNFLYKQLEMRYHVKVKRVKGGKLQHVTGELNLTKELYMLAKEYILPTVVDGQKVYRRDFILSDASLVG